jgi:5-methylcytosine-specific restriction endonuclease McrA
MSTTLLLNASYEPLTALPVRRAVWLVLDDRAEVLEESDRDWGSEKIHMKVPTVIRMKYMIHKPYRSKVRLNRTSIMARDNYECQFIIRGVPCARKGSTMDHVHPRSKGGRHEWTNVVAACNRCNAKKADKTMDQLGWKLKGQPQMPQGNNWILFGLLEKGHPDWEPYVKANLL